MTPDGVERRLAAILSADVVGYSRLMADDEDSTVRTLVAYREEVGLLVRQHRGRVVDRTGDNFLAEFASAVNAVQSALEIQSVLRARNAKLERERRMEFRIGVHLGDVRVEQEAIFGDGVNIAARLQTLAEPGGICISGAMHDQLRNKLAVTYQDLGEQSLKNLSAPVRAYRIRTDEPATAADVPRRGRVAVLPLENLSGDPEQEYFADGMTESLIGDLGKIRSLRVISRTSVMQYKNARKPLPQIARELGVDVIVEGTVTREKERVRITAQLVDGRTDEHLWAERYERPLRSVLDLQGELAQAIARQIHLELRPSERARLENRRPVDPAAHDALLKGIYDLARFTPESMRSAIASFERAIELDPDYALAHARLGEAWVKLTQALDAAPHLEAMPRAKSASLRALELDDALAEAHVARGLVALFFDWDWPASERHLRSGIELNPSQPWAHASHGFYLATRGRHEEAIAAARRAVDLAPLELRFRLALVQDYFWARRYDDALREAHKILDMDPTFQAVHLWVVATYDVMGRAEEAIDASERGGLLSPALASAFRGVLQAEGRPGTQRMTLELFRSQPVPQHVAIAGIHSDLGERDAAFAELDRACSLREGTLCFLRCLAQFDPIRDDPRFENLVRRIGIPES